MNPRTLGSIARSRLAIVLAITIFSGAGARAQCVGDCNGDGEVSISELITAVNIALGSRSLEDCPNADGDGNGTIGINELIRAVNNASGGCGIVPATATPTATDTPAATATATATATPTGPTPTPTEPLEPQITFFGLAAADDSLIPPTTVEEGIPVYELPFGRFFRVIVEARSGDSLIPPGRNTFSPTGAPPFQIQANRPLGNGSTLVCDGDDPVPGGVPAIDPPSFEDVEFVVDALNDFGCRFPNGAPNPQPAGRGCNPQEACLRYEDGTFGCASEDGDVQYCSRVISEVEEFAEGDTLLSARVLETPVNGREALASPIHQIIVRVVPPFPG